MASPSVYQELVEYVVKSMVDYPDQVTVRESDERGVVRLDVSVAAADVGRVIGKGGSVINSIRAVAQVVGAKRGKRVQVEVEA